MPDLHRFTSTLIAWQQRAGRHDLPWQNTRDPYRIWLSEIMLQQTQVVTVIPYYARFLAHFPDVLALAAAPVEAVLAQWAGLGYYARARNLHRCAQEIAAVHGGIFPKTAASLAELPGIGRSTAAAIAAFAHGERAAILDGNVKRVLCRVFAIDGFPGALPVERQLWALAESLLPASGIEAYTQGLMDLGATRCTRRQPRCEVCPLAGFCLARQQGRQHDLPTPRPRPALPERESRVVLLCAGGNLLLQRRPPQGLWGGLLVLPEGEPDELLRALGLPARECRPLPPLRHAFTHFRLTLQAVLCVVEPAAVTLPPEMQWFPLSTAAHAGVPTPVARLIRTAQAMLDPDPAAE